MTEYDHEPSKAWGQEHPKQIPTGKQIRKFLDDPRGDVPAEIIPERLYLGSVKHLTNKAVIKRLGSPTFSAKIAIQDKPSEFILDHLDWAIRFISGAIESGGKVLVHCRAGISRSATVVMAFIVKLLGSSAMGTLGHIWGKRPVRPNRGFWFQLNVWYKCGFDAAKVRSVFDQLRPWGYATMHGNPYLARDRCLKQVRACKGPAGDVVDGIEHQNIFQFIGMQALLQLGRDPKAEALSCMFWYGDLAPRREHRTKSQEEAEATRRRQDSGIQC
ncbi:hypothetical protein OQA88_1828 [Cercophora sp. LCS_1]